MSWPYLVGVAVVGLAASIVLGKVLRKKPEYVSEEWLKNNHYGKT